ncbi:hypothetical protein PMAYCL1PPCAC_23468 [Pristionchus mayeri]|uniref:Uncharacterized protein n=1 Tax=Pristionchus mayeri TaxID=1317129 RepID=A0AAN5CYR2_9BILA|nr:hypothetical protein PMAYCL1PPCAC_23468 [Pristionchus mayeri]
MPQVTTTRVLNGSLVSTTSSLESRMGEMASAIIRDNQTTTTPVQDTTPDSSQEGDQIMNTKSSRIKFMGTNSRQSGSDV